MLVHRFSLPASPMVPLPSLPALGRLGATGAGAGGGSELGGAPSVQPLHGGGLWQWGLDHFGSQDSELAPGKSQPQQLAACLPAQPSPTPGFSPDGSPTGKTTHTQRKEDSLGSISCIRDAETWEYISQASPAEEWAGAALLGAPR